MGRGRARQDNKLHVFETGSVGRAPPGCISTTLPDCLITRSVGITHQSPTYQLESRTVDTGTVSALGGDGGPIPGPVVTSPSGLVEKQPRH